MSDEENLKRGFKISIDRSAEIDSLQQELAAVKLEKETLEGNLSIIAEKELAAKCEKFGIPDDLSEDEKLERIKAREKSAYGDQSARTLYANMNAKSYSNNDEGYDSIEDMVTDLKIKARDKDGDDFENANKIMDVLAVKVVKAKHEPISFEIDPKALRDARIQARKERVKKQ